MACHDEMRWRPPGGAAACAVAIVRLPFALALSPAAEAQQFAVVASEFSGTVAMIDTRTNTIATTISVGTGSSISALPSGVAVTPDGRVAYVIQTDAGTVSVIDLVTRTAEATVPVGQAPSGVAVALNDALAYVTNACGAGPAWVCSYPGTVSVIDTASNQIVDTIEVGSFPRGVAITPDGKELYVANSGSRFGGDVCAITTDDNHVVATIEGFVAGPVGIAITPNGLFAYVTAVFSEGVPQGRIWVIDTRSRTTAATIELGYVSPEGIDVTPDGAFAYAADAYNGEVLVVDTASNTVVTTIPVAQLGSGTTGVAITPDGAFVYVTSRYQNEVAVIDTSTNTIAQTIPVDGGPSGIAIAWVPTPAPTATPPGTPTPLSTDSGSSDGCAVATQQSETLGGYVLFLPPILHWLRKRVKLRLGTPRGSRVTH